MPSLLVRKEKKKRSLLWRLGLGGKLTGSQPQSGTMGRSRALLLGPAAPTLLLAWTCFLLCPF